MGFNLLLSSADGLVLDLLGQAVTYTTGAGAAASVQGIFDAAFFRILPSGAGAEYPAVFCLLADLPSDPTADTPTVTVDGQVYALREAQPDGKGGVVLLLRETA